jgi:two-component system chemotaxis sensor kinase CheA
MAIIDAMMIRVGSERYLVPTVSIEHSFRPTNGAVTTVAGRGEMVRLRDELLRIVRLHDLFHVTDAIEDPHDALMVVVEGEGRRSAVMADEILGQQQIVIKSLGQGIGNIPGVSGGAILGDGRVGLILDVAGVLEIADRPTDVELLTDDRSTRTVSETSPVTAAPAD